MLKDKTRILLPRLRRTIYIESALLAVFFASFVLHCNASPTFSADELSPAGDVTATEEQTPTPLSEFAPADIRPARDKQYDQGLTIHKIAIEGNHLIESEKIKQSMLARPGSLFNKKTLQQDLRRIYKMGYFTDRIKAVPVSTRDGIVVRIVVQENMPVTAINIEGNTQIDDATLQKIFLDQTGSPQNITALNDCIKKVEEQYAEKGFVLAKVTSIQDDPDGMINLTVDEGKIDKVQFVGNRKTKDYVIERLMLTKSGEIYNEEKLMDDIRRIQSTQAFSDIRRAITASTENPDQYNVTLELDEKRTGAISLGGGVDTNTGLFGQVGYTDPNFLGRGQNVSSIFSVGSGIIDRDSDTQANARTYQFDLGWSDPSFMNTSNSLSTNIYGRDLSSFNIPLGVERRLGSEINWGKPLKGSKYTSVGLNLRGENVNIRDFADDDDLEEFGISDDERDDSLEGGTFISLSPTLAFDSRDNRFNPTSGWLNTFSVTGAYGLEGNSYSLINANLRKYLKIRKGITLALNAQGGHSVLGDIPEFNMFRLGGIYSVRGFQEGGLGIGNGFLMGTSELRGKVPMFGRLKKIPVINNLTAVTFFDAGTVIDGASFNDNFDRSELGVSTGIGLRLNMPGLGPIRVDYAIPLIGGGDYTRNWNFGVGQKF
ncbi:MAG: BamA/TamA family outer membrane protein [Cyanobacteria bacterium P01_H01_bin.74]